MNSRFRAFPLVLAGALAAAGCQVNYHRTSEADRAIRRVESGRHRPGVSPIALVTSDQQLYAAGEEIKVTVRLVAPAEEKALDTYLPITGRLHVKRDRAAFELPPLPGSAALPWAKIPLDNKRRRSRSFTVTINRIFPMRRTGWYAVWWTGTDDAGGKMRSVEAYVLVSTKAPRGPR